MIRHIVMWKYQDKLTEQERAGCAPLMKREIEALAGNISGIASLCVEINPLESSSMDMVLNSLFESEQALADYQIHPEHVRVSTLVGQYMCGRSCIDYIE